MPSNAHVKTLGPKNSKPPASKNAPTAACAKDTMPVDTKIHATNPPEIMNPTKLLDKNPLGVASAGQALPMAKLPLQEVIDEANSGTGVNKKKQKRRQKEAARKAAEQYPMARPPKGQGPINDSAYQDIVNEMAAAQAQGQANGFHYEGSDFEDPEQDEPEEGDDVYYTDDLSRRYQTNYAPPQPNGHTHHTYAAPEPLGGKAKKKKKSKGSGSSESAYTPANPMPLSTSRSFQPPPPPPPPPSGTHHPAHHDSKDRIWNTSTAEERERIKEFWLSLGEEDRRSLVKVEKEAVLKKMKEQQKQSCSCTVCGRKRTAIEEELEVLYDAYYEELEQYANGDGGKRGNNEDGTPVTASNRVYPHPMARLPPNRHLQRLDRRPSRGRVQEIGEDDEAADDEDYSEDEDDEDLSEEELVEEPTREAVDFFNFGKNLTVQGGILTVADDLLQNDGKKFIEMMEQLAERRMQREEEAQFAANGLGHNHGPSPNDEDYDDEEEEEYDSQEDDEEFDDEDEMESMTEVQRMDEGRRMFQIFAARMFEQRVLSAYREKVSRERQQKLIEELDAESRVDAQREAKKAKEAQKKKEKKRQQKIAKDEERAKREAAKAAEEAAAKALEEQKAEELRQKKEEQRKKKEADKRAQEEEKQRKEAEKYRRLQEAKDQQAEQERKQREQKEREKKKREEIKKKEREEREAKEAEARQKKEREAKAKVETLAKEQTKKDTPTVKQSAPTIAKRPSPVHIPSSAVSLPPGLHPSHTTSSHASPHLQIATPVIPKAPTPVRPRQPSFQESHNVTSKASQPASSSTTSPSVSSAQQTGTPSMPGKTTNPPALAQPSQPPSRYSPLGASPSQGSQPPGFSSMPSMAGNGFSAAGSPLSPMTQQTPYIPTMHPNQPPIGSGQYRNFGVPNGMPFPPGMNAPRQMPQALARMVDSQPPQTSTGGFPSTSPVDVGRYGMSRDNVPSQSHSRNTSASYDRTTFENPSIPAPMQFNKYPAPIQRPSSVAPHQQGQDDMHANTDIDDLSNHLGSKALLGDNDVPLEPQPIGSRQASMAPGAPRAVRQGYGTNQGFPDPFSTVRTDNLPRGMHNGNGNNWPTQQSPFGNPPMSGPQSWSNTSGFGRANNNNNTFGAASGPVRGNVTRPLTLRILVRTACEKLASRPLANTNGWHRAEDVLREVLIANHASAHEPQVSMQEILEICDTEGNQQNGGGSFSTFHDQGGLYIRFESGRNTSLSGRGAPGDIGSPIIGGGALPAIGGQRPFQANY